MRKRILAAFLVLCMVLALLPGTVLAAEVIASGNCGEQGNNLTWSLDSNGLLTISGTGKMKSNGCFPELRDNGLHLNVIKVAIEDGVTTIGWRAFSEFTNLADIIIPDSVISIEDYAFSCCESLNGITIPGEVIVIRSWTFENCKNLTHVTLPSSVTTIGSSAFYGCESLTDITIPNGVTSIESSAFSNCTSLSEITIPDNVTTIGGDAFYRCEGLTDITIPDGVASIERGTFWKCTGLTNITIPNSLLSIGYYAFGDCTGLTNIALPNGLTSIGEGAFRGCTNLTDIAIPNSVTSIGSRAFADCPSLSSVKIPDGVTSISEWVFGNCTNLIDVHIPNSVTSIDRTAFQHCAFTGITIPDSITSIDSFAFNLCENLSDVYYLGTKAQWNEIIVEDHNAPLLNATIHCTDGDINPKDDNILASGECGAQGDNLTWVLTSDGTLTISGTGEMEDYSEMENAPWRGYTGKNPINTVKIGDNVTSIGDYAFQQLGDLTTVTISNSVKTIGERAFGSCFNLSNIVIPNGVISIGYGVFSHCNKLTTVTLPSSVTDIGLWAFSNCTSLSSVTIPVGVTLIPSGAFYVCDNLTDVYYSGTKTQWGTITITDIGNNNAPLHAATIHCTDGDINPKDDNVLASGECGAQGNNLTWVLTSDGTLTISGTGEMANKDVWHDTDGLFFGELLPENLYLRVKKVVIEPGATTIGTYAFSRLENMTSVEIPNSVNWIEGSAFSFCKNLTNIAIPSSITYINIGIFEGCSNLSYVVIPDSVKDIGLGAFADCVSLADAYYAGTEAQWKAITIEENNDPLLNATIHFNGTGPDDVKVEELPQGVKYVPYYYAAGELTGTSKYEVVKGAFPRGLNLDESSGEIHGAPTVSGTFEFTIAQTGGEVRQEQAYKLVIQDNSNSAVQRPNDYEIIENVGDRDPRDPNSFLMDEYRDETFAIDGPYQEFYRLLIDGVEKIRDVDYTVREGSTIITVRSQTFRDVGEGTHTIAAEFRGKDSQGKTTVKQVAQNYTLTIKRPGGDTGNSGNSVSSGNSGSSGSSSTNYSITIPKIPHCTVKVSPSSASVGTRVTLTVKPNTGYLLDSVSVTGPNGAQVALTQASDGKYTFRMPDGKINISAQVTAKEPDPVPAGDTPFMDIKETDWFYSAVRMAYQRGWMVGVSANTFAPQEETSRGMIVSVLHRIAGQPAASNTYFSDVPLNQYYTAAAAWAAEQGIISGYGDGRFGPTDSLTREQIIMILYNYASKTGMDTTARSEMAQFTDLDQMSAGAQTAMSWAHAVGLINGVENSILSPVGTATRAEMAVFLERFTTLAEGH